MVSMMCCCVFFFKQKTAYEMRISDWSSDVCSSDLYEDRAWRLTLFGDEVEAIHEFDPLTGDKTAALDVIKVYANSHYVTPRPTLQQAAKLIKQDLKVQLDLFNQQGKLLEAQRLEQIGRASCRERVCQYV